MIDKQLRAVLWIAFICVVIGLFIQIPYLIQRGYPTWDQVRAENAKAQAAWSHMYGVQTDRAIASIDAVKNGDKVGKEWM